MAERHCLFYFFFWGFFFWAALDRSSFLLDVILTGEESYPLTKRKYLGPPARLGEFLNMLCVDFFIFDSFFSSACLAGFQIP